jgi:hypothetical protein
MFPRPTEPATAAVAVPAKKLLRVSPFVAGFIEFIIFLLIVYGCALHETQNNNNIKELHEDQIADFLLWKSVIISASYKNIPQNNLFFAPKFTLAKGGGGQKILTKISSNSFVIPSHFILLF